MDGKAEALASDLLSLAEAWDYPALREWEGEVTYWARRHHAAELRRLLERYGYGDAGADGGEG